MGLPLKITNHFPGRSVGDVLFAGSFPEELRSMLTIPIKPVVSEASCASAVTSDSPGSTQTPSASGVPQTISLDPDSGGAKRQKPLRYDLIPTESLAEVALLYGLGARLYGDHNWRKGYKWSLSYAALRRHSELFWAGEAWDEDGAHHLAAVVFHSLALMYFTRHHPEKDDRP